MANINNLNQLKKALTVGTKIEVVEHWYHPECTGQIREITKVQTNGVYQKPVARRGSDLNEKDMKWVNANGGKGSWLDFGKAANWHFCNGLFHYCNAFETYDGDGNKVIKKEPVATYRLIKEV